MAGGRNGTVARLQAPPGACWWLHEAVDDNTAGINGTPPVLRWCRSKMLLGDSGHDDYVLDAKYDYYGR